MIVSMAIFDETNRIAFRSDFPVFEANQDLLQFSISNAKQQFSPDFMSNAGANSEPSQTSKMKVFVKILNG